MDIVEILDRYSAGDEFQRPVEAAIEEIEQLRQRVAELEKERDRLSELCDKWNFECDELGQDNDRLANVANALKQQRDELVEAIALAMPVMDAHAGDTRKALFYEAIASVKGGAA